MSETLEHIADAENALNKVSEVENSMDVIFATDAAQRAVWDIRKLIESKAVE